MNLKKNNDDLMQRICDLEEEMQLYKNELENYTHKANPDLNNTGFDKNIFHYISARVNRNKISGTNYFIGLNKGSNHGIKEDMAVVSTKGIIGVIIKVTPHYSLVNPVLNSGFHPSCMIKNSRFSGPLFWDGKDPRYITLGGLPSHVSYAIGDTVVTSGYSAFFPEGVLVGVIESASKQKNEEYNSLKVRLFTDFSTLNEVFIIQNPFREEQLQIEKSIN